MNNDDISIIGRVYRIPQILFLRLEYINISKNRNQFMYMIYTFETVIDRFLLGISLD